MAKTPTTPEAATDQVAADQAAADQAAADQAAADQAAADQAAADQAAADQAAAAAQAEAEAKAKADADAAAAKLPKPRARKAVAAPAPNLRVLNHLTKQVEMLNHYGLRQGLLDEMRDLYGAKITEDEVEGVTITIEGVGIDPSDTMENALKNWANAARRTILEATA